MPLTIREPLVIEPRVNPPLIKPYYIDPAGDPSFGALTAVPPFVFRNVTARIFSLRANMAVLRTFCDQYLNMNIPPTIVHYSPALPYVYLEILNYGSMSYTSVQAQNLGWVSQHEVTFMVLLQRWRQENGELVFKDWATVCPFIYVDDPSSLAGGREVYGWNKVLGTIQSEVPLWVKDPRAPMRKFGLSVADFATTYAGDSEAPQPLLQVELDPSPSFTEFPIDPRNPWSPIWAIPNAISNTASFVGDALDTALALRLRGFEDNRSVGSMLAMAGQLGKKLKSALPTIRSSGREPPDLRKAQDAIAGLPNLFTDSVTLKQFRNAEDPSLACYQALINSKMGVDRVNRVGLLGDVNLLRGDSSGGYTIRLHQLDSQPIIQTLGLMVDSWSTGDGAAPGAVATLKPILPSWMDVDLYYGKGDMICSRSPAGGLLSTAGDWRDEQNDAQPTAASPSPAKTIYYNTSLGAATQPIAGPFHFPDVTVQVYPLLADRNKLDEVVEKYINNHLQVMMSPDLKMQKGWRFETFSSYVYMMATVYGNEFGDAWSGTNNIGGFFDREVTVCIPVKWFNEKDELMSVAVIEPFTFSNNGRAVATDREVTGYNSVQAKIESPKDVWMTPGGPIARRKLLSMEIEVLPALNLGQKAQCRPLLEVDQLDALPTSDAVSWREVADNWGGILIDELKRKTYQAATQPEAVVGGKALALELLAYGNTFNRIILKQYRDGANLDRACYQALVHATSKITAVYDIRRLGPGLHVRMYRQPGNLIAEALGLQVKHQESSGGEVIDVLQPLNPFWMRLGVEEDLATVAAYRVRNQPFQIVHPWFEKAAKDGARRPLAGQKPYFTPSSNPDNPEKTRVGRWLASVSGDDVPPRPSGDSLALFANAQDLGLWLQDRLEGQKEGANLRSELKSASETWLRTAIINQLAWMRICVDSNIELMKTKYARSGPVDSFWNCNVEPGAMSVMAEQYDIQQLSDLEAAIAQLIAAEPLLSSAAKSSPGKPPEGVNKAQDVDLSQFQTNLSAISQAFGAFVEVSTKGIRETGLAWSWDAFLNGQITSQIYRNAVVNFPALDSFSQHAFLMSLPKSAYPLIEQSTDYISSSEYSFDMTFEDFSVVQFRKIHDVRDAIDRATILSDILDIGLLNWMSPDRWKRYTVDEAAKMIANLDEVQIVIDDILSCGWENHSLDACGDGRLGDRRPAESMLLETQLEPVAIARGLQRWVDPKTGLTSDFWVVPIPGASDSIKAGYASGPASPSTHGSASPVDGPGDAVDEEAGSGPPSNVSMATAAPAKPSDA